MEALETVPRIEWLPRLALGAQARSAHALVTREIAMNIFRGVYPQESNLPPENDLIAEFRPQIQAREGRPEHTEVVLLNAELLGIEAVAGGHLASVRYSGMLREAPGAEAFRFEEVWNLYKAENAGWLLAGIQQMPGQQAN